MARIVCLGCNFSGEAATKNRSGLDVPPFCPECGNGAMEPLGSVKLHSTAEDVTVPADLAPLLDDPKVCRLLVACGFLDMSGAAGRRELEGGS